MNTEKLHRRPAVEAMTALSRSTIYSLMEEGKFPRPVRIGKRAVAWKESDILIWLESREITEKSNVA